MRSIVTLALLTAAAGTPAISQTPVTAAPAQACCTIPALTEVEVEILAPLNSQASKIGEKFPLRLARPIVIDGVTLVPAGAMGSGDVVHAEKSRFGGRAGEMILAARYIEHQGHKVPLRSLRPIARGQGKDNSAAAVAAGALSYGVLSMFITGGEVDVPAGTIMTAKVSAATTLVAPQAVPASTGGTSTP